MCMPDLSALKIDPKRFPLNGTFAEKMRFVLQYVRLASAVDSLPAWRFEIENECLSILLNRSHDSSTDSYTRQSVINCGISLFNLRVALAYFGCSIEIRTFPYEVKTDEIAQVRFNPDSVVDDELAQLFSVIFIGVDNHNFAGASHQLTSSLRAQLISVADAEEACLAFMASEGQHYKVVELAIAGDFIQFDDPNFRSELVNWIHNKRSLNGMALYALGVRTQFEQGHQKAKIVMRIFDTSHEISAAHQELLLTSPILLCLTTNTDNMQAWLATGQALQHVLLLAESAGFTTCFLNRPTEVDILRNRLREILSLQAHPHPQLLLRLQPNLQVSSREQQ